MILRIGGGALVLLATSLIGYYFGNLETYRVTDLQELKKALCILKSEIEFSASPLPEAVKNISMRTKGSVSKIFARFAELVINNRKENINLLWERAWSENKNAIYLSKEDLDSIFSFGKTLGYLDKDMQSSAIFVMVDYIDQTIEKLNETRSKNKKLFQSLGVLSGIAAIIVLI